MLYLSIFKRKVVIILHNIMIYRAYRDINCIFLAFINPYQNIRTDRGWYQNNNARKKSVECKITLNLQ